MKKITREDLLNGWLKYHNTTVKEVATKHPKKVLESTDWFDLYPITQEQFNEWEKTSKEMIRKSYRLSKRYVDRKWGFICLDCAPNVIKTKENEV